MDAFVDLERLLASVKDDSTHELIAELIAQPDEVPGIGTVGSGTRLHLDRNESAVGRLQQQVDFPVAALLAKVAPMLFSQPYQCCFHGDTSVALPTPSDSTHQADT